MCISILHKYLLSLNLLVIAIAAMFLEGCTTPGNRPTLYEKDGVTYGVTKGVFRSRWWNYYERGCSYLDGGYYAEAENDFRAALQTRAKDQRWPRTYGLHFVPEYFPNRELGIALYHQQQVDESMRLLEASIEQHFSARAAFYLAEARRQWVSDGNKDTRPPEIEIRTPAGNEAVASTEVMVEGIARDDRFVSAITVGGQPVLVNVCAAEVPFEKRVVLDADQDMILVEVTDITGKKTSIEIPILSDVDGPVISFDRPCVIPGMLSGVAFDPSGIVTMHIAGKPVALAPGPEETTLFSLSLSQNDLAESPSFECVDGCGNVTRGIPPIDLLVLKPGIPDVLFASNRYSSFSLGMGLCCLVMNGENVAIAAQPVPNNGVIVEMNNILDGQQYFTDEIVVAIQVSAENPIQDVSLNGKPIPTLSGRNTLRTSRKIRLAQGINTLAAHAVDDSGQEGIDEKVVHRDTSAIEMEKNKLTVAFLGTVGNMNQPNGDADAEYILDALAATTPVSNRFTVISRSLLDPILTEQTLSEALASSRNKLALGRLIPAEVMITARTRRDQNSIEIVLEGSSTETAVRIFPPVDVAGPYGELYALIEELGVRLVQEIPRVQGQVLDWDQPEITMDLNASHGIRKSLKCLVFRMDREDYGEKPVILCEGIINNVMKRFSTAEAFPVEESQALDTVNIEPGQYVIIK
ncbi:MAG: hypothetical protein BWY09_01567 [Candidatus Hydrogenedentes bacterium ADurb.Bin179]|nr:MAG: hypothetical protein BWY09_01567 [Candidatus Hydrogenedentes bacterium ADurb.Bin179]